MYISVIVPVYNAEKYLEECLDSILSQTFADFELLLVNDGSSDGSGDICRRYALRDSRIRFFDIPNGGVSAARNLGLDNALGERIVFVDADDTVEVSHLERFVEADAGENGVVFCNLAEERPTRFNIYPLHNQRIESDAVACKRAVTSLLRCRAFGWTWNKMFSRSLIERIGLRFDEEVSYAEDEIFTIRYCTVIDSLSVSSYPTYKYRLVQTSLLHSGVAWEKLLAVRKTIVRLYEENGFGNECCYLSYRTLYSRLRRALREAVRNGDDAAVEILVCETAGALRQMKHYRCRKYFRQFYDWKVAVTGSLVSLSDRPSWMKFMIATLHL